MNRKLLVVLIFMAIIPIGLLSWMGIVSIQSDRDRQEQQIQYIGKQKLELVQENINLLFKEIENDINKFLDLLDTDIDTIRILQRDQKLIQQVFLVGEEGLLYPSFEISISKKEDEFLSRIKETDISYNFLLKPESEALPDKQKTKGWHTWFMGDGINFIYWKQSEPLDTVIKGVELNRPSLISEIINSLPTTNDSDSDFRISLRDVNGDTVYQWGSYNPLDNTIADSTLSLNYPLSSWHLEYFVDPYSVKDSGNSFVLSLSLLTLFIVIIFLSVYLYRESNREIREASQKVSFVNQVSHELKTPLTNIRMYAELLEKKFSSENSKTKKQLNIIISESSRLGRLINNVLSFAKDKKNGVNFNPSSVIPDTIIMHTLDSFKYSLKTKGIKLSTKLKSEKAVLIDPDILEQILSNLLSNVEKYAAEGKWVKVESLLEDGKLFLTVSDRGPGIPENLKERIFEPFFRISNKLTDGVSGTGIGLSLVRTLAEIHGGKVSVLSGNQIGKNEGAVFQVTLKNFEQTEESV